MADIDDVLRSDESAASSWALAEAVMENLRLERRAPLPVRPPRRGLVAACLALALILAAVAAVVLASGTAMTGDAPAPAVLGRLHPFLDWAATSGRRMLVATLGLLAVLLLVRHAERSV